MVKKTSKTPSHKSQIVALRRIEGQVRGVQKMIEDGRYCVDIVTQLHSILGAVGRVQSNIFQSHLNHCFTDAVSGKSAIQREKKITEVIKLLRKFRKAG
jgi:DNA-binding FrmR family transcriptional regulator